MTDEIAERARMLSEATVHSIDELANGHRLADSTGSEVDAS
jgi:DNA-binding ferritin-like protein